MRPLEFLFVVALILYTTAIWSHKIKKEFRLWMIWLFGFGLTADIAGTVFLCVAVSEKWIFNLHTVSGLLSLVIMAIHFLWALLAIKNRGKFELYFNRFSIKAWLLWLVAFISGIPI